MVSGNSRGAVPNRIPSAQDENCAELAQSANLPLAVLRVSGSFSYQGSCEHLPLARRSHCSSPGPAADEKLPPFEMGIERLDRALPRQLH